MIAFMRDLPNKLDFQLAGYYIEGKTFVKLVKTERGGGGGGKESVIAMYWPCICGWFQVEHGIL